MRNIGVLVLVVGCCLSFTVTGNAGLIKGDVAKGPILYIDPVKQEMRVADSRSGREVTYTINAEVAASFQKGQVVIVRSDPGSTVAKSVRLAVKRK